MSASGERRRPRLLTLWSPAKQVRSIKVASAAAGNDAIAFQCGAILSTAADTIYIRAEGGRPLLRNCPADSSTMHFRYTVGIRCSTLSLATFIFGVCTVTATASTGHRKQAQHTSRLIVADMWNNDTSQWPSA